MKPYIINSKPDALEELLATMDVTDKYDYLKVILSKSKENSLGKKYIMITREAFGVIRLLNVTFSEPKIILDLENPITGQQRQAHLNIEDSSFKFLLVNWQDIRNMVQ